MVYNFAKRVKSMIKAVIFDFDGLILDTETAWYESYKDILLRDFEFDLKKQTFRNFIGTNNESFEIFLKNKLNLGSSQYINDIKEKSKLLHEKKMLSKKERNGIRSYLKEANDLKLKKAIATSSSKEWVEKYLQSLDLLSEFDVLVTKDDVTNTKPHPEVYTTTLKSLSMTSNEVIVFEDSQNGLEASYRAGLDTIIVPNELTKDSTFENYFMKLNSMTETSLLEIIKKVKSFTKGRINEEYY